MMFNNSYEIIMMPMIKYKTFNNKMMMLMIKYTNFNNKMMTQMMKQLDYNKEIKMFKEII